MSDETQSIDDALDAYLDGLSVMAPSNADGLSSTLVLTITSLSSLDTVFAPDPATKIRIWETVHRPRRAVIASTPTVRASSRSATVLDRILRPASGRPSPRRHLSPAFELLAAAALIALMVATAIVGHQDQAVRPQLPAAAPSTATANDLPAIIVDPLYFSTDPMLQLITPIDPLTLADHPDRRPITIGSLHSINGWALSGDGSTLATITIGGPDAATTIISDARTGIERSRIPVSYLGFRLNYDGSRIMIPWARTDSMGAGAWLVYDTASANQLSTIPPEVIGLSLPGWSRADLDIPDPTFHTLYRIVPVGPPSVPVPSTPGLYDQPTQLQEYDLTTGTFIRSVDLPGIVDQLMTANPDVNADIIQGVNRFQPSVSPDGSLLAIPYLDGTAVAMVDTSTLTITQRITLLAPENESPTPASDTETEGRSIRAAVFAPDGDHLYVFGFDGMHTQGLHIVDQRNGAVVVSSFANEDVLQVVPSPDGQELYVVSRVLDVNAGETFLRRVDPNTLAVRAERTFSEFELPILVLQPEAWRTLG